MTKRTSGGTKRSPAKKRGAYNHWSEKEVERLRKLYPKESWEKLLAAFPGRKREGISRKAYNLEISRVEMRRGNSWTKDEKKRLTRMWPQGTPEDIRKAFPDRTWGSIKDHARHMNLKKETISTWTEVEDTLLRNLYPSEKKETLLRTLAPRTWQAIQTRAQHLQVKREAGASHDEADEKEVREKMVEFLARARTEEEFVRKFGNESLEALRSIDAAPPEGFVVLNGTNTYQEKTFYLSRLPTKRGKVTSIQERVFTLEPSENDPEAYFAVVFPPELSFTDDPEKDALKLFPIDSSHWGSHLSDKERLIGYIRYLESKPYAFAFLNGDNIGGSQYDKWTAETHRESFAALLRPVAHKIMWAQSGDLEEQMRRIDGIDPLRHVCRSLGIHHTERPVMVDVYWKHPTHPIEITAVHGRSNAHLIGAMVNAVNKIAVAHNFPHFTVLGHLQAAHSEANTVRRLNPAKVEIKEHVAYSVIAPGFQRHEGSTREKKGYPPKPKGMVAIVIRANNDFSASS